jgi:hypothetical protein
MNSDYGVQELIVPFRVRSFCINSKLLDSKIAGE